MRWVVVAVGKLRQPGCAALCDDYLSRLRHYTSAEVVEARSRDRLETATPARAHRVALTRRGVSWSSRELARRVDRWKLAATDVAFLIGDADGLPDALVAAAEERWCLSALTLPHELARVVLLEQLYRAETILRGEPYHRDG